MYHPFFQFVLPRLGQAALDILLYLNFLQLPPLQLVAQWPVLYYGLPLVLMWTAAIAVGWLWGERLRALEETADEAGQRSLVDRRMRLAFAGVGKYALLTVVWLLFFAVAWWVRTRFFR